MPRTYMNITFKGGSEKVDEVIRQILIQEGYREIQYNLETVWKMGTGVATSMHYIKLEYKDTNTLVLAGWVQNGIGSVGGKEHDLEGMTLVIPKKSVKKTMEKIKQAVLSMPVTSGADETGGSHSTVHDAAAPSFCPNCGCKLPAGAVFCSQCGKRLPGR